MSTPLNRLSCTFSGTNKGIIDRNPALFPSGVRLFSGDDGFEVASSGASYRWNDDNEGLFHGGSKTIDRVIFIQGVLFIFAGVSIAKGNFVLVDEKSTCWNVLEVVRIVVLEFDRIPKVIHIGGRGDIDLGGACSLVYFSRIIVHEKTPNR